MIAIAANGITKAFGKTEAVSEVNFSAGTGEIVGLIGRNGAGKSTLMRMLTGYFAPTEGSVRVCGADMAEDPLAARKHIGYMPEVPPLYFDLTVREHLLYVASLRGFRGAAARKEAERVCEALRVSDVRHRLIKNLSKGYRQRVGFAAALTGGPEFLILDEPTAGLDPRQTVELRELIASLSGHTSFIISSHILTEISSICSRILILHGGRIAADGSPDEIAGGCLASLEVEIAGPSALARRILESRVGEDAILREEERIGGVTRFRIAGASLETRRAIFEAIAERRGELSLVTLRPLENKLEDVFMELTGR